MNKIVPERENFDAISKLDVWRQELLERVLRIIAILAFPLMVFGGGFLYNNKNWLMLPVIILSYLVLLASAFLFPLSYKWRLYGFLTVIFLLAIFELVSYGIKEDARIYLLAFVLFSAIFAGHKFANLSLALAGSLLFIFSVAMIVGVFTPLMRPDYSPNLLDMFASIMIFLMFGVGLVFSFNYLIPRLVSQLAESSQLAEDLKLEKVALGARTLVLQQSNSNFQRRAMYLDASTQVSQVLATIFDVDPLLEQAVDLITRYFGFYHTGIFMLDETGDWAVLQAASSLGGRKMLTRGHRLRRGSDSMVGWVAARRQPRISENVGKDAVYFANPDLPDTHSAMTMPLIVAGRLIGVLDVQSTEESAFDQDDIRTLQGLSAQLAIAINNARRLSEEASVLEASSPLYRLVRRFAATRSMENVYEVIGETIRDFNPTRAFVLRPMGERLYVAAEMRESEVILHDFSVMSDDMQKLAELLAFAAAVEKPIFLDNLEGDLDAAVVNFRADFLRLVERLESRSIVLVPIRVELQILGLVFVTYNTQHRFSSLETQLYNVLSDLSAVALERMKLVLDAQGRLGRERWIRDFSGKMMRISDMQLMVVQAAESLQQAVGADGVILSVSPPSASGGSDKQKFEG